MARLFDFLDKYSLAIESDSWKCWIPLQSILRAPLNHFQAESGDRTATESYIGYLLEKGRSTVRQQDWDDKIIQVLGTRKIHLAGKKSIFMTTTQTSLLLRLRTRQDSEAWNRFVKIYTPLVHYWVQGIGVEKSSVNDVVQEVFVVLLGKTSWLVQNRPNSFRSWLRTVTLNKCRDFYRKKGRKTEPKFLEKIEIAEGDPTKILTEIEYQKFVASTALKLMKDSFSEATWTACWKMVVDGKSAKEVSSEIGISENAAYLARSRVIGRLRQELSGLWD